MISPEYRGEIETCFRQSSPAIRKFLRLYTSRDFRLAEELVQETFLRAADNWTVLRKLEYELRLAWLQRVAANAAVDAFRRNGTARKERPAIALFRQREVDPYREALTAIAIERLVEVIDGMPPRRRLVAFLRWRCGWKSHEIADALHITPAAVSQQLTAARTILRRELQEYVPFDSERPPDKPEDGDGSHA